MINPATYEIDLTDEEKEMFEKLLVSEAIHNEIAFNLGAYKQSILDTRNEFVRRITKKYGIEGPSLVTYDPLTRKIVSIFHPKLKSHKIDKRPYAFKAVASDIVISAIKKLREVYEAVG